MGFNYNKPPMWEVRQNNVPTMLRVVPRESKHAMRIMVQHIINYIDCSTEDDKPCVKIDLINGASIYVDCATATQLDKLLFPNEKTN